MIGTMSGEAFSFIRKHLSRMFPGPCYSFFPECRKSTMKPIMPMSVIQSRTEILRQITGRKSDA
jgi:hypothetical protein